MARSAVKREQILDELRMEIVSGAVPRGARLPTRLDLERRFQVSGATIQQALDKLRREGFVVAQGSRGTFVSDNPPHLCQYGLLFPAKETEKYRFSRYFTAMANAAATLDAAGERRISCFYGLDGHADVDDFQRLVQDLHRHCLAGLIFVTHPDNLKGTPVLDMPGIPRVAVRYAEPYDGLSTVQLDDQSFLHRAIKYLVDRGRKRIAVVRLHSTSELAVVTAMRAFGVEVRPHWLQTATIGVPECIRPVMRLLMHPGQPERPDGLIITDDNFEIDALGGLIEARVSVPEDLEIVCHVNHPASTKTALRVQRLGYDTRRVLGSCVELIDRQRLGEPPASIRLQPVFEGEFPDYYYPPLRAPIAAGIG